MLASLSDHVVAAVGATKSPPPTAGNWDGWAVVEVKVTAWRRGALVVDGDGLGEAFARLEYVCEYGADQTRGAAARTRAQLLRLGAALVHDSPGSLVPPLGDAA